MKKTLFTKLNDLSGLQYHPFYAQNKFKPTLNIKTLMGIGKLSFVSIL